jgi:hypothetical protein
VTYPVSLRWKRSQAYTRGSVSVPELGYPILNQESNQHLVEMRRPIQGIGQRETTVHGYYTRRQSNHSLSPTMTLPGGRILVPI